MEVYLCANHRDITNVNTNFGVSIEYRFRWIPQLLNRTYSAILWCTGVRAKQAHHKREDILFLYNAYIQTDNRPTDSRSEYKAMN
jgi:hypothetical protein